MQFDRSLPWRSLTALLLVLALAGCSSTKTAYRYADWGLTWWVEDYVSLTDAQERQLQQDLQAFKRWHCQAELPRYVAWLDQLDRDLQTRAVDRQLMAYHQQRLFDFLTPLTQQATAPTVDLLASLSDEQVAEIERNMAERQQEKRDEYLLETSEQTHSARAERVQERVERWLGPLNGEQIEVIEDWSEARGDQTRIWLEGRRNWQLAFAEALAERDNPGFDAQLAALMQDNERFRGEDYNRMITQSRAALVDLNLQLLAVADERHWEHLQSEVDNLRDDLADLTCGQVLTATSEPQEVAPMSPGETER